MVARNDINVTTFSAFAIVGILSLHDLLETLHMVCVIITRDHWGSGRLPGHASPPESGDGQDPRGDP